MTALPIPSIHLITSRRRVSPDARTVLVETVALEAFVDEAIDAGVDIVQIRERDLDASLLYGVVARIVARARPSATRILVNERADVAAAAGAAGVHVPSTGMAADEVRRIGPTWIVGRSIHNGDVPADRTFTDYLLFGTVFPSESKPTQPSTAGLEGLRAAILACDRPVVALGGITPARAHACIGVGAAGVAGIGVFLPPGRSRDAMGPQASIRALRDALSGRE